MAPKIKLAQWNCRGLMGKTHEFPVLTKNRDVITFSETWLKPSKAFKIPFFDVVRRDRGENDIGGGVAIAIRKSTPYRIVPLPAALWNIADFETIAVEIKIKGDKNLLIFSIYRAPHYITTRNTWELLFKEIINMQQNNYIMITGDLNAQSPQWGSNKWNTAGRALAEIIQESDLIIINDGSPTYFGTNRNSNVLDLTITDAKIAPQCEYLVTEDLLGSDHAVIDITVNDIDNRSINRRPAITVGKVDWQKFNEYMREDKSCQIIDKNNCVEEFEKLITQIKKALLDSGAKSTEKSRESTKNSTKRGCTTWWNKACSEALERRRMAFKKYKQENSEENLESWIEIDKAAKAIFKKEKTLSFKNYAEKINPKSTNKEVWDIIKKFNGNQQTSYSERNIDREKELIDEINKLSPPPSSNLVTGDLANRPNGPEIKGIWIAITYHELNSLIGKLKPRSAAGRDQVNNVTIENLPPNIIQKLVMIYNKFMYNGIIPQSWRDYDVCMIPKAKGSFRPISLASCFLKLFEKCIKNRLDFIIETDLTLPRQQFGFRKGKSCVDNTAILSTDIYNSFAKKEAVAAMFIDIEGAYDNVVTETLIKNMSELRLPNYILKLIENLINKRDAKFYSNGTFIAGRKLYKGLPQGSVLSPLLFNVYLRKINKKIGKHCYLLQFADDIVLYTRDLNLDNSLKHLEEGASLLAKWLAELGLNVAPSKSKFMVFTRRKNVPNEISIRLNGTEINRSHTTTFLGVTFDSKLNWKAMIQNTKTKTKKSLSIIKMLAHKPWGGHPSTLLLIYKGLIRAKLDWAFLNIHCAAKSHIAILDKNQSEALRLILGLFKSTPINVLRDIATENSLEYRAKIVAVKYLARTYSNKSHPLIPKLRYTEYLSENNPKFPRYCRSFMFEIWVKISEIMEDSFRSKLAPCYEIPLGPQLMEIIPNIEIGMSINNEIHASADEIFNREMGKKYSGFLTAFTDGSKSPSSEFVGASFHIPEINLSGKFKANGNASIFEAEALAIRASLTQLKNITQRDLAICSDSLSVLEALRTAEVSAKAHPLVLDIKSLISRITSSGRKIILIWCPSHRGLTGNERADQLANEARENGEYLEIKLQNKTTAKIASKIFENQEYTKVENSFKSKGIVYGKLRENKIKSPWFTLLNLPRKSITALNRLRSGHTSNNEHLNRIGLAESPDCLCGFEGQDLNHIFWACPLTAAKTITLTSALGVQGLLPPFEIRSLAFSNSVKTLEAIVSFMRDIRDACDLIYG